MQRLNYGIPVIYCILIYVSQVINKKKIITILLYLKKKKYLLTYVVEFFHFFFSIFFSVTSSLFKHNIPFSILLSFRQFRL